MHATAGNRDRRGATQRYPHERTESAAHRPNRPAAGRTNHLRSFASAEEAHLRDCGQPTSSRPATACYRRAHCRRRCKHRGGGGGILVGMLNRNQGLVEIQVHLPMLVGMRWPIRCPPAVGVCVCVTDPPALHNKRVPRTGGPDDLEGALKRGKCNRAAEVGEPKPAREAHKRHTSATNRPCEWSQQPPL